jgi:hypothetical protein
VGGGVGVSPSMSKKRLLDSTPCISLGLVVLFSRPSECYRSNVYVFLFFFEVFIHLGISCKKKG